MKRFNALSVAVLAVTWAACGETISGPPEQTGFREADEPAFLRGGRPYVPGEQQPTVDLTRGITYALHPTDLGQNLLQTFAVSRSAKMSFVRLPVGCTAGVALSVKVRDGVDGPILAETNVVGLPSTVDGTFHTIQLTSPATRGIKLRTGRTYALELASFRPPGVVGSTCGVAPGPLGDSYAGGQGFFEDVPTNGAGWRPLPTGAPGAHEDLPFITLVR